MRVERGSFVAFASMRPGMIVQQCTVAHLQHGSRAAIAYDSAISLLLQPHRLQAGKAHRRPPPATARLPPHAAGDKNTCREGYDEQQSIRVCVPPVCVCA